MQAGAAVHSKGARLVAIAKERLGNEEFLADHWNQDGAKRDMWKVGPSVTDSSVPHPNPELLFDAEKFPLFKYTNGQWSALSGLCSYLCCGAVSKSNSRVDEKGIKGNFQGEGTVLGAVLVINGSGELLMHHQEKSWGDHPDDSLLLEAIDKL